MKQAKILIVLLISILMTGCAFRSDGVNGDIVFVGDEVSANQMETLSDEKEDIMTAGDESGERQTESEHQAEEKEIVCDNPYFFPQNTSFIVSEIYYIEKYNTNTDNDYWLKSSCRTELELHWLKQYDNGCLVRLSIVPFMDPMPDYMDETRMNIYFYVTAEKIYRINLHELQNIESLDFENDDMLLISTLDSDEKLVEYGEIICCPDEIEDSLEEGEAGTHTSVRLQDNQVSYNRVDMNEKGDSDFYENFIWEEGKGLVGYMSGYDAEETKDTRVVYLEDILYGTTDQVQDEDIVCENPYFFPQDVSLLNADITYGDWFTTIENEMELHWLKQYDNGCLARLSVAPFDYEENYLGINYFHMYFYVTPDEIYRIQFFVSSADRELENGDAYIDYNDNMLMTVLNTDERLMEYGELVCSLEEIQNDVEEGEEGTYLSLRQEGEQILYRKCDVTPYDINAWEDYCWENGQGLVEYRRGFSAERDPFYITNIVAK